MTSSSCPPEIAPRWHIGQVKVAYRRNLVFVDCFNGNKFLQCFIGSCIDGKGGQPGIRGKGIRTKPQLHLAAWVMGRRQSTMHLYFCLLLGAYWAEGCFCRIVLWSGHYFLAWEAHGSLVLGEQVSTFDWGWLAGLLHLLLLGLLGWAL